VGATNVEALSARDAVFPDENLAAPLILPAADRLRERSQSALGAAAGSETGTGGACGTRRVLAAPRAPPAARERRAQAAGGRGGICARQVGDERGPSLGAAPSSAGGPHSNGQPDAACVGRRVARHGIVLWRGAGAVGFAREHRGNAATRRPSGPGLVSAS